jgi:hypothetical protein
MPGFESEVLESQTSVFLSRSVPVECPSLTVHTPKALDTCCCKWKSRFAFEIKQKRIDCSIINHVTQVNVCVCVSS